MLLEKIMIPCI